MRKPKKQPNKETREQREKRREENRLLRIEQQKSRKMSAYGRFHTQLLGMKLMYNKKPISRWEVYAMGFTDAQEILLNKTAIRWVCVDELAAAVGF